MSRCSFPSAVTRESYAAVSSRSAVLKSPSSRKQAQVVSHAGLERPGELEPPKRLERLLIKHLGTREIPCVLQHRRQIVLEVGHDLVVSPFRFRCQRDRFLQRLLGRVELAHRLVHERQVRQDRHSDLRRFGARQTLE